MNRIVTIAILSSFSAVLFAQNGSVSVRVGTDVVPWARFLVDGQYVQGMTTFTWPVGSKHVVQVLNDLAIPNSCPANLVTAIQKSITAETAIMFNGWKDNKGLLVPTNEPVQTITADASLTSLIASFGVSYRVVLNMFQGQPDGDPVFCQPATAGAPWNPFTTQPGELRPGIAYIDGVPYWSNAIIYLSSGSHTLNAFPSPGFTFDGWAVNGSPLQPYLTTFTVAAGMTLTPRFEAAKRVRFITDPMGLNVLIDHVSVPTTPYLKTDPGLIITCPGEFTRPPAPPPGILPLCLGDFDFAPNTTHVIGAPTPQNSPPLCTEKGCSLAVGPQGVWVFDHWDGGGGQNWPYRTDNDLASMETVRAKFLPGAVVGFYTSPNNLPVTVDGRSNYPYPPLFTWALGSKHTFSVSPSVTDSKGRKYTFKKWSNEGSMAQDLTVDQNAVDKGLRVIASYDVLSRLIIQTTTGSDVVEVDGKPCPQPCIVDRQNGTQVRVSVPSSVTVNDSIRYDLTSWSDNGASEHVVTMDFDTSVLTANYQTMMKLTAMSNPSNGATFQFSPATPDLYYPSGQPVTVTTQVNPGFKFRRWGGDISGTFSQAQITLGQPCTIIAQLDTVPYIAPAGVQNAAGPTPDQVVAPGSIIAVLGASLTTDTIVGPTNPLAQTLNGVVVTVADRMLPLLSVSPTQVTAQLPGDLPEGDYTLTLSQTGQQDVNGTFTVARNAPGLFTWSTDTRPIALATHEDGSPITPESPAQQGETVTIYGTGFGPLQKAMIAGFLLSNAPPNPLIDNLTIQLDATQPSTTFAGAAPDKIGMEIVRFKITADMPSGQNVDLKVTVNGRDSNTVQLPL